MDKIKKKDKPEEKTFGFGELKVKALKENQFEFVASGIKEDRYGEVVDPAGFDFKAFKKNPVMLWAHNHQLLPIAKVIKIWKDEKQVYAKAEWADTPFAQEVRQLVEGGFLNCVSVGFLPREWEGDYPNYKFTDQELLEISVVNVPAYAEALMQRAKSMGLNEVMKKLEEPEEKEITITKKEYEELKKKIEKEAKQPVPKEIMENLNNISKAIENLQGELKALKAEVAKQEGKKVENNCDAENRIKLLKICDKAIEAILLKERNK